MQVCPPSCSKCLPTAPLRSCSEHHSGIFPHQLPLHLVPQTLFLKHSQKSHFVPHISGGWTHLSFTQELHWWVIPKCPRIPANILDAFWKKHRLSTVYLLQQMFCTLKHCNVTNCYCLQSEVVKKKINNFRYLQNFPVWGL